MSLFNKRDRRATILASVPWFLQDLSTCIGIFTPAILAAALGKEADHVRRRHGCEARWADCQTSAQPGRAGKSILKRIRAP